MNQVFCVFVSFLLISQNKDRFYYVSGQQQEITESYNIGGSIVDQDKPKAWPLTAPESMLDDLTDGTVQGSEDDHHHNPSEWNGQEPLRRRRRPGRKRKRRPQGQRMDVQESNINWHRLNDNSYREPESITISIGASQNFQDNGNSNWAQDAVPNRRPIRNRNKNRNDFVPETIHSEHDLDEESQIRNSQSDPKRRNQYQQNRDNSYRKPYSVAKKERESTSSNNPESVTTGLKDLLKQSGGLSLSELLQQQNLSLDDLLKGKRNALKALQSNSDQISIPEPPKSHRRLPSNIRSQSSIGNINETNKQIGRNPPSSRMNPPNGSIQVLAATIMTAAEPMIKSSIQVADDLDTSYSLTTEIPEIITIASNVAGQQLIMNNRLPSNDRVKPIKGVISGIRPDLSNSNTRKRLLPLKLKPGATTDPAITIRPAFNLDNVDSKLNITSGITIKEKFPPRFGSGYRLNLREIEPLKDENVKDTVSSTSTPSTTTTTTTTERPDIVKQLLKSRLALRPRLRLPNLPSKETTIPSTAPVTIPSTRPTVQPSSSTTTTTRPTTTITPTTTTISTTEAVTIQDTVDTTTIIEDEFSIQNTSPEDFKEIIEKSEPQANAIDDLMVFKTLNEDSSINWSENEADHSIELEDEEIEEVEPTVQVLTTKIDKFINESHEGNIEITPKISERMYLTENSVRDVDVTERNPSLFVDVTSAKYIDDRTDLLELLDDRRSGARLYKVLAQRNMTLEELIEHRQRGSSQLHLAEIFNNKTKTIAAEKMPSESVDIVTAFDNFPAFNFDNIKSVKPDEIKTDSQGSSYFTSITNIKPTDEAYKEGRSLQNLFSKKLETTSEKLFKQLPFTSWKPRNYPIRFTSLMDNNFIDAPRDAIVSSSRLSPLPSNDLYPDVVQIENEVARAHDLAELDESENEYKRINVQIESAQMSAGIRSAIVASASIVGVSVFIFIVIFATCRWRQNRKKKITYAENFQAVRSRLPILTRQSSTNLSKRSGNPSMIFPTMSTTRNSKLNTMDPNSPEVQEYLYDAMRKPFSKH